MPEYRAYLVGPDDHILQCVEMVCADDAAAKEQAKTLADGYDIELWQEARKIAVIHSLPAQRISGSKCHLSNSPSDRVSSIR
jgi:hypothetical protein